jgi:hypothetical protein
MRRLMFVASALSLVLVLAPAVLAARGWTEQRWPSSSADRQHLISARERTRAISLRRLAAAGYGWLPIAEPTSGEAGAPQVLRVGTFRGIPGQFASIQQAIDVARPHDIVLVAPGDYKTSSWSFPRGAGGQFPAAVLIQTPDLTLRGMNRNRVVIDGTRPGTPRCADARSAQNFGPAAEGGPAGLNGIEIWKADDVVVENLTACNFLGGSGGDGGTGNEIWWNGGANSAHVGGWGYYGAYLTATSTWYDTAVSPKQAEVSAAEYGIFSSNWSAGTWDHTYASNMNDSGYYIGACQQICDQVIDNAWSQYNALGYSGSNSGGRLLVENSQFDDNEDGFDTNSQNGDNPPPQNGDCPNDKVSPITHTHSCWVFMHNYVHNNNNPNVPTTGFAAAGPVGTGMSLSGARNDTVMDNLFADNGAWGVVVVPFPDSGPPCTGGTLGALGPGSCLFDEWGDAILHNRFANDGFFHNPTNGDFDYFDFENNHPTDCFAGNIQVGGGPLTPEDQQLQRRYPLCNGKPVPANLNPAFLTQVGCDSGISVASGASVSCPPGSRYPRFTGIAGGLHPLPPAGRLVSMPNPCAGVPANPWCSGGVTRVARCVAARASVRVALDLAPRQRLVSWLVTVDGHRVRAQRRGGVLIVALGPNGPKTRVVVAEVVSVRSRRERFRFTRIYRRCS